MLLSRIGPIALEEPLGGSADSNVLRGIHVERNLTLAVKLLPRELVNRPMGGDTFADDVKRLQGLVHPSIARVMGGAMDNGQPYLAIELVKGESLRSVLDRRGRLPWETMVDVAEAICEALAYAHSQGVVHQRLTPDRVLLVEDGGVKLVGFDCALGDRDAVLGLKSPMRVANYLAPEEFRGKKSSELPTCDLFSLGVILFEGLSGQLPWSAATPADLVQARRAGEAPRVSAQVLDCPVWLDVLVSRLLAVKRDDRLQSADAARRAIVDAKSKVAAGMGAAQHALSGRQGALARGVDRRDLKTLRKAAAAPAPKDESPFYERAWFLAVCLLALAGVGAWVMWPLSEAQLYERAAPLMESDDPVEWRRAQPYVDELKARFPDTEHAAAIAEFEEKLTVHAVTQRMRNLELTGRMPPLEIERQFLAAWRDERLELLTSAWEKYSALVKMYGTTEEADELRYVEAARWRLRRIEAATDVHQPPAEVVRQLLLRAQALAGDGRVLEARMVLEGVLRVYGDTAELAPLMAEVRDHLESLDTRAGAE